MGKAIKKSEVDKYFDTVRLRLDGAVEAGKKAYVKSSWKRCIKAVEEIEAILDEVPDNRFLEVLATLKQDDLLEEFLGWLRFASDATTKETAARTLRLLEEKKSASQPH